MVATQCNGWAQSKGRRCLNRSRVGQRFCYLHVGQANESPLSPSEPSTSTAVLQCKGWAPSANRQCRNKPRAGQSFCHLHQDQRNEQLSSSSEKGSNVRSPGVYFPLSLVHICSLPTCLGTATHRIQGATPTTTSIDNARSLKMNNVTAPKDRHSSINTRSSSRTATSRATMIPNNNGEFIFPPMAAYIYG
jgi:hypothetical protein